MSLLEQFGKDLSRGLTDQLAARDAYYAKLHKKLASQARAIASDMSDKECVVFAALLLSADISSLDEATEKVAQAILDAGDRIN